MAERVEIDGLRVACEDSGGDGPAALLIHGLGGSLFGWRAQIRALSDAGYRAVAYDQRGAGLTRDAEGGFPAGPYSVEGWAEDAERVLDALGVERAALVGHSMGCMVAEQAALRLGERCWALALCGGVSEWPEGAAAGFEQRAELARSGRLDEIAEAVATTGLSERCRSEQQALWGLMVASIAASNPGGYAESALATGRGAMRELEGLGCPVLAFAGSEDPVTPPSASEEIARRAVDGEARTIDGAAHWCMLEAPDAVSELLVGFLGLHRPS